MSTPDSGPTGPVQHDDPPVQKPPAERPRRLPVAVAGLLFGLIVVLVLPGSWVFVDDPAVHAGHDMEAAQYACPMFCVVMDHMPENGKCPVCGMTMTVISGESTLDRAEQRMIGLEAGTVQRLPLVRTLRVVGEVDYDETRLARITTRVGGWLETVWIDSTWAEVQQGEPLASIYSPELYSAEQEYLVALKGARGKGAGGTVLRTDSLLRAARKRLQLLDVDDQEIADLEKSDVPRDSVVLRSPMGGVVVERRALEGASVTKGASLYTVADLSRVWVQALVFENDLPWVRKDHSVRLEVADRAERLAGVVAFVDPAIDRMSRTARIRIEVANEPGPDGIRPLRIGQRLDAWIEARLDAAGRLVPAGEDPSPRPLAIPRSAVLRTGERNLVYVLFTDEETPQGRVRNYRLDPDRLPDKVWYEPLELRLGPLARVAGDGRLEEFYPVLGVVPPRPHVAPETGETHEVMSLRRLTEGVAIVTKGNLLLDSQAQLAGKPSLLFPEGNRGASADPHAGH